MPECQSVKSVKSGVKWRPLQRNIHWTLDVAFNEDMSRKRIENSAQNFSLITKIGLNILKNDTSTKIGIKGKRLKAGWSNSYLEKLLGIN